MSKEREAGPAVEEGRKLEGATVGLAIVASEYHSTITQAMLDLALQEAERHGATVRRTVRVPGVYDLPLAVKAAVDRKDVDAVVTLGAVLKGETDHDQVIMHAVAKQLLEISVESGKPVALGVTGPGETLGQARARIGRAQGAVRAAILMVGRLRAL